MIEVGMTTLVRNYARQTQERVGRWIQDLENLRGHDPGKVQTILDQLGQLAQQSVAVGFDGISGVAGDMTRCLAAAQATGRPLSPGTIAVLIDACHVISLHAEALTLGLVFPEDAPHPLCRPSDPRLDPA